MQESTRNMRANLGANFGENFGNCVSILCFGNFVQQKGDARKF